MANVFGGIPSAVPTAIPASAPAITALPAAAMGEMQNMARMLKGAGSQGQMGAVMQMMAQRNPEFAPLLQMMQGGGDPSQMIPQLARQKGLDPSAFLQQVQQMWAAV